MQVMENAAIALRYTAAAFTVHVHSHGYRGYGPPRPSARYFASHGWVTVAPGHTQNTIIDHVDPLPVAHFLHRPGRDRSTRFADGCRARERTPRPSYCRAQLRRLYDLNLGGATYDLDSVAAMCATGEGLEDDGCTAAEEARFGSSSPTLSGRHHPHGRYLAAKLVWKRR